MVPKLDRARPLRPDARAIGDDLAARGIKLSLGGQVHDPADPGSHPSSAPSSPRQRWTGCTPAAGNFTPTAMPADHR